MWFSSWLRNPKRQASPRKRPTFRPTLEALEERYLLSTLTVLNTNDSRTGSLRADIALAQNGDTIQFASSLDGQTITLKGELLINKNLTLAGFSDRGLTISGNNASRVFEAAAGTQVTLSGLTISNGMAVAGDGGGVLVDAGAVLTVNNSTLSGNSASFNRKGVGGQGGAIYNDGTTTVSGSTLSGNSGNGGSGAIYNHATLTVNNNSAVSGNFYYGIVNYGTATVSGSAVSDNSGSGIANGGTFTVSDSTLSRNSATDGGGIYNNGTATLSGCTLSDNSATEYGGAIYSGGGHDTLTVSGCTRSGNSAADGGGIFVYEGTVTVSGSTLSGNTAKYGGGGIDNQSNMGTVTVENSSTITGNTAHTGLGADVYNLGVLYLDSTSIIGILDGNPAVPI
jgi:predicted outer membrane repeat protein